MPEEELPEEFLHPLGSPSISSLSSNSSDVILINAHYIQNGNSPQAQIRSGSVTSEDSLISRPNLNIRPTRPQQNVDEEEEEMTYQPIKIPKEPTLEELLRQVTGNSVDFREVNQIKLRIISSSISLHRLPYFLPQLRILNLEGSILFSLRDLGCDLNSLTYLNVSRCGLKSIDGTNGLTNLTEFVCENNQIEDAGPCSNLPQIRKISMANNKIRDFQAVMFLGLCENLRYLDLTGNFITQKANYRETINENLSNIEMLDKIPFNENMSDDTKTQLLSTEFQPGENQVRRNLNQLVNVMTSNVRNQTFRPIRSQLSTPDSTVSTTTVEELRPSTAARDTRPKYDISIGEPVVGSIITRARKPRNLRTAWGESCSSSSLSSTDSNHATPNKFLHTNSSESYDEILANAKAWREKNKASREKFN